MTDQNTVAFRRYNAAQARDLRDMVAQIHDDAYAERIKTGDPFGATEAFMRRFDAYASSDGFDLLVAYVDGSPAGQAWGWPLGPDTTWWRGLRGEVEAGFTDEDGTRTFALSEIMIRQPFTGRGIAHMLHDELLSGRKEKRATLLVNPDNKKAYLAYLKWGWCKAAELRPDWPESPLFDVLMLDLSLAH